MYIYELATGSKKVYIYLYKIYMYTKAYGYIHLYIPIYSRYGSKRCTQGKVIEQLHKKLVFTTPS